MVARGFHDRIPRQNNKQLAGALLDGNTQRKNARGYAWGGSSDPGDNHDVLDPYRPRLGKLRNFPGWIPVAAETRRPRSRETIGVGTGSAVRATFVRFGIA